TCIKILNSRPAEPNVGVGFIPILHEFTGNLFFLFRRDRKVVALLKRKKRLPVNSWRMGINPTPTLGSAGRLFKIFMHVWISLKELD
ncbi:MAG: hypothetical protein SPL37_04105, partial [Prevotella sp.]|nr:hypothetical protein [Prevotella sp.]